MKPGDHPDFYKMAPPPGASRESSIVLDREGRFWHEGALVENASLARAMRTWIAKHPDDGRLILTNGYDWCYFRVEDAPFIVDSIRVDGEGGSNPGEPPAKTTVMLRLFDGTEEPLDPATLRIDADGIVYARVKGGAFEARLSRHAHTDLAPLLISADPPVIRVGGAPHAIARR